MWDGTPRVDTWLSDYLGAEDTPYTRAVAAKSLVAAVGRVRTPGCQVDTVPVLEGPQGVGKSSALRALFGSEQFVDHLPDLTSKDAAIQLQGIWCVEFAELDKLSSAESARAKAFITTRFDRYRRPYGRVAEDVARRCVFSATLNPGGTGYLRDETGNRRYWPIACAVAWVEGHKVDVRQLTAVRDQLWAEASWRYFMDEPHWLDTGLLEAAQAQVAAQRFAEDAWAEPIHRFVAERPEVSVSEVLGLCLGKPTAQWTKHDQMRVGAVLTALGWVRKRVRVEDGKREWRYLRGDNVVELSHLSHLPPRSGDRQMPMISTLSPSVPLVPLGLAKR
jgi:predicted P-loop ATPase